MNSSDIPSKFPIPFAASASSSYSRPIPTASQIGTAPGAASLTDGFPPLNFLTESAGGIPPDGRDINGILNQLSAWARWQAAGGPIRYDAAYATAIGGYPLGAILQSTTLGASWQSTADGNTSDPDGGSPTNWRSTASTGARGANGYRISADGYIEQWGIVNIPAGSNTTTFSFAFPIPFLSEVHGPYGNADNRASTNWGPVAIMFPGTTLTGSNCCADTGQTSQPIAAGRNLRWYATGY